MRSSTFHVRIHFEERVRGERREFHFDSTRESTSREAACDAALAYFWQLELLSGVGWPRQVLGVEAKEVVRGSASFAETSARIPPTPTD